MVIACRDARLREAEDVKDFRIVVESRLSASLEETRDSLDSVSHDETLDRVCIAPDDLQDLSVFLEDLARNRKVFSTDRLIGTHFRLTMTIVSTKVQNNNV